MSTRTALRKKGVGYWSGGISEFSGWDSDPFKADNFTAAALREFELDKGEEVVRLTFTGSHAHVEVLRTQGKRVNKTESKRSRCRVATADSGEHR
jgi:hypothetical protein